ncbi:MAG: thioredoxin domain-containing protein [Myxococcales bacterium]|nr:thioredoxin domain-containing protein [Myxococcales bacterium]MCB9641834.1 thioredoxin domain-containing protein [Myxococcales bacterium]
MLSSENWKTNFFILLSCFFAVLVVLSHTTLATPNIPKQSVPQQLHALQQRQGMLQQKVRFLAQKMELLEKENRLLRWELSLIKRTPSKPAVPTLKRIPSPSPKPNLSGLKGPTWGAKHAPVTIVTFSDFQCGFCARGARVVDQLKKRFGNKIRIIFKHMPLSFHSQAHLAAQASMEANAQGKFWPYHDKLFANMRNINRKNLIAWGKELGMNTESLERSLAQRKYKAAVDADLTLAQKLQVSGTPTFFINGEKIVGARPLEFFADKIQQALRTK